MVLIFCAYQTVRSMRAEALFHTLHITVPVSSSVGWDVNWMLRIACVLEAAERASGILSGCAPSSLFFFLEHSQSPWGNVGRKPLPFPFSAAKPGPRAGG
jgi:hypothetical protein